MLIIWIWANSKIMVSVQRSLLIRWFIFWIRIYFFEGCTPLINYMLNLFGGKHVAMGYPYFGKPIFYCIVWKSISYCQFFPWSNWVNIYNSLIFKIVVIILIKNNKNIEFVRVLKKKNEYEIPYDSLCIAFNA